MHPIATMHIDQQRLTDNAGQAVDLLKSLANRNRLLILCALTRGEASVSELNAWVDISQSALSQHLALLRAEGLVTCRRDAQTIRYALADSPAIEIIAALHAIYCT